MAEDFVPEEETFRRDVLIGLQAPVMSLSSKYFYDAEGDAIFQEIMALDEYYLTRSELEILRDQSEAILECVGHEHFDIIELGAGDGQKTEVFLSNCLQAGYDITYVPVDISSNVLSILKDHLEEKLPALEVRPLVGEYLPALEEIDRSAPRRLLMFLGGTIGNFRKDAARTFMKKLGPHLRAEDYFLVGIDLKKDPRKILSAYDDTQGVTKRFNLNLLRRINRELGADFDLTAFEHYPTYDPLTGTVASFLVSMKDQNVKIGDVSVNFEEGGVIHTEVSMKYDLRELEGLGDAASLHLEKVFMDSGKNYCLALFHR